MIVNLGLLATLVFLAIAVVFTKISHAHLLAVALTGTLIVVSFILVFREIIDSLRFTSLLKKNINVTLSRKTRVDLSNLSKPGLPRRIIILFSRSRGFFSGNIVLRVNAKQTFSTELPVLREYASKLLEVPNKEVTTDTNRVVLRIPKALSLSTLEVEFDLKSNVLDPVLKQKFTLADEEAVELDVRGLYENGNQ